MIYSKVKINKREQIESKEIGDLSDINNNNNFNTINLIRGSASAMENSPDNSTSLNNQIFGVKKKWIRKFSFKSQAGKNENGIKTNQDSYLIMDNILNNDEFKVFGVLDGHGNLIKT